VNTSSEGSPGRGEAASAIRMLAINYARRGVRHSPSIALGLMRASGSPFGLGRAAVDSRRTAGVMSGALDDALGPDWRARVERPFWPEAATVLDRPGLIAVARSRRRYTRLQDKPYGSQPDEVLDVWRHPDLPTEAKAPIVLQIPGGAWIMGNKQGQAYPLMNHLAQRGWVCAAMSYRCSPRHRWPAHIVDVKLAIAWLREHALEFGGDPGFIAVTGGSAGGHLAALSALSQRDPAFQPGFESADTSVQAAVPLYGRYDWVSRNGEGRTEFMRFLERVVVQRDAGLYPNDFRQASPLHRAHPDAPPFYVIHGRNDTLIPVEQAREFVDVLRAVSDSPVAYAELPGAQHSFDLLLSQRSLAACESIEQFLGVVLAAHRATGPPVADLPEGKDLAGPDAGDAVAPGSTSSSREPP
jgi:acetyl esterase/lipase